MIVYDLPGNYWAVVVRTLGGPLLDPITIIEVGGGVVTFVGAAAGGKIGYGRSKRHHQALAIQARTSADSQYTAVSEPLLRIGTQVESITALLGPVDSAAFRKQADKVVRDAQELADSYAAFAYQAGDKASPSANTGRSQYIKMASIYSNFANQLSKQIAALNELSNRCQQVSKSIDAIPATAKAVEAIIEAATAILNEREEAGWVVVSYAGTLAEATDTFANAEESRVACEFITAAVEYADARHLAASVASAARELPKKQQALQRRITSAERQEALLRRNLAHARESVPILMNAYDPACTQGVNEALDVVELQLTQFAILIADLREDIDPKRDAWEAAEATAGRLDQLGQEIAAGCKSVEGTKAELDERMQDVRTLVAEVDAAIHSLYGAMSRRDYGGNQAGIREVVQRVETALNSFARRLNDTQPNVYQFEADARAYKKLVQRLDRASKSTDYGDYSDATSILNSVDKTLNQLTGETKPEKKKKG